MNIFSIDFILFSVAGYGVSLLELLSVMFGLTCVFLAGRGNKINYWFGYVYTILLFLLFMQKQLYSSMLLQPVSLAIAIFGHYRWTHPKKGEANKKKELKVSLMTNAERIYSIFVVAVFTVAWGYFMKDTSAQWPELFKPATRPFLDAFVVAMILLAQYLSAGKKLECWDSWLVVNTTNIILYISAGLVFMPMVSAAYLILAFFGFATWRKEWRTQDENAVN